jgi:hypothetical protein
MKRKRHGPEQFIPKLGHADRMFSGGNAIDYGGAKVKRPGDRSTARALVYQGKQVCRRVSKDRDASRRSRDRRCADDSQESRAGRPDCRAGLRPPDTRLQIFKFQISEARKRASKPVL